MPGRLVGRLLGEEVPGLDGAPRTSSAQACQISSGSYHSATGPAALHSASVGQAMRRLPRSVSSCSRSSVAAALYSSQMACTVAGSVNCAV